MLSLLLGAAVWASAPEPGVDPGPLEVIQVTATRRSKRAVEVIAPVTVVDSQQLGRIAPVVTADALRGQTGVFVQQTTPGQGIPIVRGLKGSEVLHMVDGVRFNNALFRNAPNQYLALLDPALLSAVEVVRGPVSSVYGADAMGGVVQFVTRRPEFADQPTTHGGYRASAGSADDSIRVAAFVEQGWHDTAVRAAVGLQRVGDRETASGTAVPSGFRAESASASWRKALSDSSELQLDLQHLRQPSTPRIDELVAGFGQSEAASQEFYFEPNQRDFAHLRWQGQLAGGWADNFEVHLAGQKISDDRRSLASAATERRLERNASTLWVLSTQFDREWRGATQWVWGAELTHDRVDSQRLGQDVETGQLAQLRSRFPDRASQQSASLYTHVTAPLGEQFKAEAGLRYSRFAVDLPAIQGDPAVNLDLGELTASLGLSLRAGKDWYVLANLGQGFRAPNIFDLGTLGERPGNRFNIANTALEPEHLTSLDVGLKWAGGRWLGELVAFVTDYEDKIVSVPTGALTPAGRIIVRSENGNEVRLTGLEVGLRRQLSESTTVGFSLNSVRGTERATDGGEQPADRVPPLNGRLTASWTPDEQWRFDASVLFARQQDRLSDRDLSDPRINPLGTPGWSSLDLRVGWRPQPGLEVSLSAHNLADKAYREHGSGIDAPGRGVVLSVQRGF